MRKGRLFLIGSAFLYGFTPVLAIYAYRGGLNSITLTFLRSFLSLPILFVILKIKHISLKLSKKEWKDVLIAGVFGNALMLIALYASYDFIPVGLATVLHYIYPLFIILACVFLFHEKLSRNVLISSILVTIGILFFADIKSEGDIIGIILAVIAGILFAFNIMYLDKSGLDHMNYLKLTFYFSLIISVTAFAFAIFSNDLTLDIAPSSWGMAAIISVLITFAALPLFQLGVLYEGSAEAGILSTAEPITGVLAGVLFLNETITLQGVIGCLMIISGIVIAETQKGVERTDY